MTFSSHL